MPRRGRVTKDGPESGEDSDEYRKRRDKNNMVTTQYNVIISSVLSELWPFRQSKEVG